MSDDLRRELADLEARLVVLRRALAESGEPDGSEPESDAARRARYYGGGGDDAGIRKSGDGGLSGGLYMPRGGDYGG